MGPNSYRYIRAAIADAAARALSRGRFGDVHSTKVYLTPRIYMALKMSVPINTIAGIHMELSRTIKGAGTSRAEVLVVLDDGETETVVLDDTFSLLEFDIRTD